MPSLPTELYTEILQLALPSSSSSRFDSSTYQERVSFLSNFSLACRAFQQVADPFLYATFWARNKRQFDAFVEAVESKGNSHLVRQLVIDGSKGGIPSNRVPKAAKLLTEVQKLSLFDLELSNLKLLNGYRKLESLTLEGIRHRVTDVFTLPSLQELTVGHKCSIDLSLVTDKRAPQLTSLALRGRTDLYGWEPTLSSHTPWNLDAFVLDWYSRYEWHTTPNQSFPNVLFNLFLDDLIGRPRRGIVANGFQHFQHFRFFSHEVNTLEAELLIRLIRDKSSATHQLETLILPLHWNPDFHSDREVREKSKTLSDECVAAGVDLIYEEESDGKFNSNVSQAFVEKMQRLARVRQQAEAAQSEEEEEATTQGQ
ncbi:uncharacterized protein JCM6883_007360 [Sporobolomyces salmoneus]|uniref:uncharacterized protein n=1 Tax=Sporobolomyces salmoneus TaxID=183962 RepID=UPI00316EA58C